MTFRCVTNEPTIVREPDGSLLFVGEQDDPRREAVERMAERTKAGKMPDEADVAMVQDLFVIDEIAMGNIIFIIA